MNPQHLDCHKIDQNQYKEIMRTGTITSWEESQKIENQSLDGLKCWCDIDITKGDLDWMKYRTWFYKKMKKKTLIKIEDFKVHH
jgi:hypothetical protein